MSSEALELKTIMEYDSRLETISGDNLVCIGYCPNVSYFSWLFEFKNVYVLLTDMGNGYYTFDQEVDDISGLAVDCYVEGQGKRHYRYGI